MSSERVVLYDARPGERLGHLVQTKDVVDVMRDVVEEYRRRAALQKYGLDGSRRLVLSGAAGVGKTFVGRVLAGETGLPLYAILLDDGMSLVELRDVFDEIARTRAVWMLEGMEAVRKNPSLYGFLRECLKEDRSDGFVLAALTPKGREEYLLLRECCDEIVFLSLPDNEAISRMVKNNLGSFIGEFGEWFDNVVDSWKDMKYSHAVVKKMTDRMLRKAVLAGKSHIDREIIEKICKDDAEIAHRFKE